MRQLNVLSVLGTRPEAIKMAPVIRALNRTDGMDSRLCISGQHQQMLSPVLELFGIIPDYNLNAMRNNQSLTTLSTRILEGLTTLFTEYLPDVLIVHGDTTTSFVAALAAFYHKIPVVHIEAGLRTGNLSSPWPEEANRKLTAMLSVLHFAPTMSAHDNLLNEGIKEDAIVVTGNTVVDALQEIVEYINNNVALRHSLETHFPFLSPERKFILVTGHRRENFGQGFEDICSALLTIAKAYPEIDIVYPVHLNPAVQKPVRHYLANQPNIYLIDPVDYLYFVFLMQRSYLILTDSGGIQEEAPSLGKPVLVMRDHTERMEAVAAGCVKLVGTNAEEIIAGVTAILTDQACYDQMSQIQNPYGDGNAAQRIVQSIKNKFNVSPIPLAIRLPAQEEIGSL
ncbi:MAG: UDP-N-acetylglucosamine 2-epimerase (non-hydrolyzing) [Legionellaceae bacterium]|nr:UDP-N-acetylglucosamine 2-epimerase (non-hydrolyzing) [Legionellaceae bacterium]